MAAETVKLARGGSLQAAGLAMHVLADTWAHSNFAGTPSLVINNTNYHFFELLPDGIHLVLRCVIEGLIRIVIFLAYMWLCTRMKEIRRLFRYHGAEHKSIFCYEKGLELTVENVRQQSRFHPRCGTSFLVVVMIIAILLVSVMTWVLSLFPGISALPKLAAALVRVLAKLILLPIIVSVTYELNRWVGRHDELLISRIIAWPGKQMQHLTTAEPDDGMMVCAIEALKLVIPENQGEDAW